MKVLKGGLIAQSFELTGRPWFAFGRSASCEVVMEHPSSSRVHAVLQVRSRRDRCGCVCELSFGGNNNASA